MTVPSAAFAGQAPRGMKMKPSDFMTESSKRTPEQKKEIQELKKIYKGVTDDEKLMRSLEMMKGTLG